MDPHHAYKSIAQREGLKKTQRHFEEQDEMPCSSYIKALKEFRAVSSWDSINKTGETKCIGQKLTNELAYDKGGIRFLWGKKMETNKNWSLTSHHMHNFRIFEVWNVKN